jgi:sugar-specific transcriptional regulator TrmB
MITEFQQRLAESDSVLESLHKALRGAGQIYEAPLFTSDILPQIPANKSEFDANWKATEKVKFVLKEVGTVMSAKEIVKYIERNHEKGFSEKVGTKVHVALNTFCDNKTLKIYEQKRPFRYGFPEWFENDNLKEEYEVRFKALQQVP